MQGCADLTAIGPPQDLLLRICQSRHPNMKELRAERAIRVLFAFDPRRTVVLLIGGDKSPDDPGSELESLV